VHRMSSSRGATEALRPVFFTTVFFCLTLIGCGNSCFVFVSNPGSGGGTIAGSTPSCSLSSTNGTLRLRVTSSVNPALGAWPANVQHIFVTFRGIQANPSATADEDSADWQELAPNLATQPVQIDLLAPRRDNSCEPTSFGDVTVPADAYRQIRLRLSSNQPVMDEPVPEENACGRIGLNCIVTADGGIRPLVLARRLSQVRIPPDHIAGGFFQILPETPLNLTIEFIPYSSVLFPQGEGVQLVPVFAVDSQPPCVSLAKE
jgi:Domain of unknown function (DUF4382)